MRWIQTFFEKKWGVEMEDRKNGEEVMDDEVMDDQKNGRGVWRWASKGRAKTASPHCPHPRQGVFGTFPKRNNNNVVVFRRRVCPISFLSQETPTIELEILCYPKNMKKKLCYSFKICGF